MKRLAIPLFVFHFSLFIFHSSAAVPLRWTVETSAANPATFDQFAGATYELEAALQSRGKPLAVTGEPRLYWQTNGMGSAWWSAPASASGNVLRATWTPSCDVGARAYSCFIGVTGSVFNAAFQLRLRPSPGATPNELPLPVPTIDFAKVTVLNPPWPTGRGVGTNDVVDIVRKTVAGSPRYLPKYLWLYEPDDSYPDDAAWYYAQPQPYGSCSAVRDGGFLSRNYDWKFDDAAEFVVRMSAGPGRFASVGVANCGTNLTEQFVASGGPSRYYKCLPGRTVDGINEHGVVCEVNVVDGEVDPDEWSGGGDLHPLAAVRWVLDHATNALHAAKFLKENIKFPLGWRQNFHWMIADERGTWVVENGDYHAATGRVVMTNFPLYPAAVFGAGWERYVLLTNSTESITNAWYTRAYSDETEWLSEFHDREEMNAAKIAWDNGMGKGSHRGQHDGDKWWWQTVHTSVYDITNRTLRVAVQEVADWYTVAVPSAGGVKSEAVREIVAPMIGAATKGIHEQVKALQDRKLDASVTESPNTFMAWAAEIEMQLRVLYGTIKSRGLELYGNSYGIDGDGNGKFANIIDPALAEDVGKIADAKLTRDYIDENIEREVSANLNTYVDGETGVEYVGKMYDGNLYYVPTGNVYPPNN